MDGDLVATRSSKKPTSRAVKQWAAEWLGHHRIGADSLESIATFYLCWLERASSFPLDDATTRAAWEYLESHHGEGLAAFYAWEYVLEAASPNERVTAGVYFTPAIISRWLVNAAIGRLLGTESAVTLVDPACGTGVILSEAIRHIAHTHLSGRSWRVCGVEKNPSTASVAEGLAGRSSQSDLSLSAKIVCADALAYVSLKSLGLEEKATGGPLIILGNPPYSTGKRVASAMQNEKLWIDGLLADYRASLRERKTALADDYVRFLRWSQHQIESAGSGVLAMITSRTFLEGITHHRMRESLRQTFDELYVVDLAGDMTRNPDKSIAIDENIFPIRSGVALLVFTRGLCDKKTSNAEPGTVFYQRLTGSRKHKLEALAKTPFEKISWSKLHVSEGERWRPSSQLVSRKGNSDYGAWLSVGEAFRVRISGIQSKNDALWTADTKEILLNQIAAQGKFESNPELIREYAAAPFVKRFIYYDPQRIGRARFPGMRHMLQDNLGLVFARQSTNEGLYDQIVATRDLIVDRFFYSRRGTPFLAPLVLYEEHGKASNFRTEFVRHFLGAEQEVGSACQELIFAALLALMSSRVYRTCYADELRVDFPRVPPRVGYEMIERLAEPGRRLIDLHCEPPTLGAMDEAVFSPDELARAQNWTLGGFRVLKRWGRDRAQMPVADNEQWRPILQRWRAIEQTLDRIDPVVSELLDQ